MRLAEPPIADDWDDWKDALGLSARCAPEVYADAGEVGDVPHAGPIRAALRDLGADSVFCIEDVPTAVFFVAEDADASDIAPLHSALWNQGLASVLAVVSGDAIRIYSLAARPKDRRSDRLDDDCLIEVLKKVEHEEQVRSLIRSMESGRYWQEHDDRFDAKQRVDGVLLGNLKESDSRLQTKGLLPEASQALLMQAMFIAYLEDRGVIDSSYIRKATGGEFSTFADILQASRVTAFYALFRNLNRGFNGDLFVKPCSFDESGQRLMREHLPILADFHSGMVEMGQHADQTRLFWAYNFKFIPVELISAVYDQFLGVTDRVPKGQFHTPKHLATSVVSQLWDEPRFLAKRTKTNGTFLDPACGSGIFLVCVFKRLCEQWRHSKATQKIQWRRLEAFINQLTGLDIDANAVRVAIFSLYIALLEEVNPPDIRKLMAAGKLLPKLWGVRLRQADFFDEGESAEYDVVIGNPPWRSGDQAAAEWCGERGLPAPDKQAAWGFTWKALGHLKQDGKLALLLPAMPFLHRHSKGAVAARSTLLKKLRVSRIVNYADLRRQLFAKAKQPTALFIGGPNRDDAPHWFEYWVPKADAGFSATQRLTISDLDKGRLDTIQLAEDPLLFNKRLWMTSPEDKLFRYLKRFPPLRATVAPFKDVKKKSTSANLAWIIGHGFQEAKKNLASDDYKASKPIATAPFLPSDHFRLLSPDLQSSAAPHGAIVRRRGFERGYHGPRVLVPRGVASNRLRAAYVDVPLTFQDAIQAIVVPERDRSRAKVAAAMLNSKLMFWFAFHASASIGSERPEVRQNQLLDLPFPKPADMEERQRAEIAADRLAALMDEAEEHLGAAIRPPNLLPKLLNRIDDLVYDYFALSDLEILLVEDTFDYIAPSVQPNPSSSPPLWRQTTPSDRSDYATYLTDGLEAWMEPGRRISISVIARDDDLVVAKLRLCSAEDWVEYSERRIALGEALARVSRAMDRPLPGNLHQLGNLGVYTGQDLYLVKPNRMRFWTRSAARADAEDILDDVWSAEWKTADVEG